MGACDNTDDNDYDDDNGMNEGYIRHKAAMLTKLFKTHACIRLLPSISLVSFPSFAHFNWFILLVCVSSQNGTEKKTKQFVIQAHLHCMKTHKPTYASHHYISFRELTTNKGNTMTINDDGDDDSSSSNYYAQNFREKWMCCVLL